MSTTIFATTKIVHNVVMIFISFSLGVFPFLDYNIPHSEEEVNTFLKVVFLTILLKS